MNATCLALGLTSCLWGQTWGAQEPQEGPPFPPLERARMLKDRGGLHRRVNGVLLTVSARVKGEKNKEKLDLEWTLAYNGPRPPLVIMRPSVTDLNDWATIVWDFAKGKDGKFYRLGFGSPIFEGINPTDLANYLVTIRKGKSLSDY